MKSESEGSTEFVQPETPQLAAERAWHFRFHSSPSMRPSPAASQPLLSPRAGLRDRAWPARRPRQDSHCFLLQASLHLEKLASEYLIPNLDFLLLQESSRKNTPCPPR